MIPEKLEQFKRVYHGGVNLIPIGSRKKPTLQWKKFQEERVSAEQLRGWAKQKGVCGFAAIGGGISGGLVVFDFDVEGFYEKWCDKVGDIAASLPTQRTNSGLYQTWFRTSLPVGNKELAYVPADNTTGRLAAIETRGEGGYAVVAPSYCPDAGKNGQPARPYEVIQGDFADLPSLPAEEAQRLIDAACSLDLAPITKQQMKSAPLHPREGGGGVIGAFNEKYPVNVILERHEYRPVGQRYLAPDSTTGEAGVYIFPDTGCCYSHHGNDILKNGHRHDAFSVFCLLEHGGDVRAAVRAAAKDLDIKPKETKQAESPVLKTITGLDLAAKEFPEPRWAIPELLPEGLILLAGKPKAGKSWFALNLAVAVATGGMALGQIGVERGGVLYLALEDSERRLKERQEKIVVFGDYPENLHFLTAKDFPPLHKGGLTAVDNWLEKRPEVRLVVIDTLARVRPRRAKTQDAYDHDTELISILQALAIKHYLAILLIHHTKKVETDDFVEAVSGTFGLTGAADCIAVLIRKDRMVADAVLKITGRDVPDMEKALRFHPDLGIWELMGEAREHAISQERQDILFVLKETGPKTPAQLAKITGKKGESVRFLLMKMKESGQVYVNEHGFYNFKSS